MKIYIYMTILIAIGCTIVYILIDRKYKNSRPDTKSEIQRNLSSQLNNSTGNLLQTDPSGNLSIAPAPLTQYYNSIAPNQTTDASPYTIKWATSDNVVAGTPITQSDNTSFILAPGYAYRIIANIGVDAMGMDGWVNCYITQNGTQIGNTGALLSAKSADGWNVSPTCLAYVSMGAVPSSIKFMITGGANQRLGLSNNKAAAWISIEVL